MSREEATPPGRRQYTPNRGLRIDDDLWDEYGEVVGPRGRTRDIIAYIEWKVGRPRASKPKRPDPKPRPATRSAGARTRRPDEEETP